MNSADSPSSASSGSQSGLVLPEEWLSQSFLQPPPEAKGPDLPPPIITEGRGRQSNSSSQGKQSSKGKPSGEKTPGTGRAAQPAGSKKPDSVNIETAKELAIQVPVPTPAKADNIPAMPAVVAGTDEAKPAPSIAKPVSATGKPTAADKPVAVAVPGATSAAPATAAPKAPAEIKPTAPGDPPAEEEALEEDEEPSRFQVLRRQMPPWLVSMLVHALVVVIMASITFKSARKEILQALNIATPSEQDSPDPLLEEFSADMDVQLETTTSDSAELSTVIEQSDIPSMVDDLSAAANMLEISDLADARAQKSDISAPVQGIGGMALTGRGEASRGLLVQKRGGSKQSELSVQESLKWLARHQLPDGGWSFDHRPIGCDCTQTGEYANSRNAATGLALLPFLGSGQTHLEGKYKRAVRDGLAYLRRSIKASSDGGSLHEEQGNMYSHGIASIALSEAYAMTGDNSLYAPTEAVLAYICNVQDPSGGGWRYFPRQPGDTSVVGWQLMALKSGSLGKMAIPNNTIQGANFFLNSVQKANGSQFGYENNQDGSPATTAVGLLCRMYLGSKREDTAIREGVKYLSEVGPSVDDIYYNYYATQVLSHYGGDEWKAWNKKLRDQLVAAQSREGHEAGSWYFKDGSHKLGSGGGRLCCTAFACMTLEVYYRYLPIYSEESTTKKFKD